MEPCVAYGRRGPDPEGHALERILAPIEPVTRAEDQAAAALP